MEGLALTVSTATATSTSSSSSSLIFSKFRSPICSFPFSIRRGRRGARVSGGNGNGLCCRRFVVAASKEDPKLDPLDQMELKFGRLLGEDPNLTISKILARKADPDADYLEVEKRFYKNKGKIVEVKEIPLDWSKDAQSHKSLDGMSLARPVPKNGFEYKIDDFKPAVPKVKRPVKPAEGAKRSVPNVILRKPSMINEPDVEDNRARFRLRPNLSLTMRNQPAKEEFSDMTLLRKPEPMSLNESTNMEEERKYDSGDYTLLSKPRATVVETELKIPEDDLSNVGTGVLGDFTLSNKPKETVAETKLEIPEDELSKSVNVETSVLSDFTLLNKPKATVAETELENPEVELSKSVNLETDIIHGLENSSDLVEDSYAIPDSNEESENNSSLTEKPTRLQPDEQSVSSANYPGEAALIGKPKRLDQSVKQTSVTKSVDFEIPEAKEGEDADWSRAENLVMTGERGLVELISCSARGFAVSFGSLVGFLPYRNLSSKWKFLAFESWLRRKGLDPALYRQSLGIIGNYDASNYNAILDSVVDSDKTVNSGRKVSADMKAEDLLNIYDEEKKKFLSSFLGQKVKVNVLLANRKSRKLLFSVKPKEKDELIEKKRNLMAKLQVGDVVKCCIKKITYFGIFVEIEEVPALIHQTEVSWDATLDPSAYFKVGQIVQAKVHQLDFSLDRIFLSLKEIMPDPLVDALESVVGDRDPLDARLQVAEEDSEWTVVESLIKELREVEGIESVSKGRFFLSPGLAPTFQVYMASMFEDQYKLLARSGNKVQEVIVKTSLSKEDLKSVILSCTNKVE